jgi:hypothetical protein
MNFGDNIDDPKVIEELRDIAKKNEGTILPEKVVDRAERESSALHKYFEWNDSVAAREYRLNQARQLLRIVVIAEPDEPPRRFAIHVSTEPGYRLAEEVFSVKRLRDQWLEDAKREAGLYTERYERIAKLIPFFSAAKKFALKK